MKWAKAPGAPEDLAGFCIHHTDGVFQVAGLDAILISRPGRPVQITHGEVIGVPRPVDQPVIIEDRGAEDHLVAAITIHIGGGRMCAPWPR